jgi:hypothetical protein
LMGSLNVIRQEKDGKWFAKCDLCQWKTLESERKDAENKLSNHISIVHKKGVKRVKKHKHPVSPDEMPPKLPEPIKER